MQFKAFYASFSTWVNSFNSHPHHTQHAPVLLFLLLTSFHHRVMLHDMNIPHAVYPFISWWNAAVISRFGCYEYAVCLVAQLCPTLCNPMAVTHQAPLSIGIFQARIPEWVAMPSSRVPSQPRDQTQVSHTAGQFCTIWATREAQEYWSG